jgi:hypothetical protein
MELPPSPFLFRYQLLICHHERSEGSAFGCASSGGKVETFTELPVDGYSTIVEGSGIQKG